MIRKFLIFTFLAFPQTVVHAGIVIVSSASYQGACGTGTYCQIAAGAATAITPAAPYVFTINVVQSTTSVGVPSVTAWITQVGPSGNEYNIQGSTFAACSTNNCFQTVYPDLYEGGSLTAGWNITGGSGTITITARQLNN